MKMNAQLFEDFLKCPTKCHLRSLGEVGSGNPYADWVREKSAAYQIAATTRLLNEASEADRAPASSLTGNLKSAIWRLAVDVEVKTEQMESRLHAVEHVPSDGRGKPAQFIPIRCIFTNKLTNDDRLSLAFDALVLSDVLGRQADTGKIIHGDTYATLKVKVAALLGTAQKLVKKMEALLATASPPDLVLIRHCAECEFRDRCRQKALEKDDLSLLAGMSKKERQKYHGKGLFTITQLSHTFRPRRHRKRPKEKKPKYQHPLKALAIREKKIHVVGNFDFRITGTPVFLDVEGLPDRDWYYLIGLRVTGEGVTNHYSFWAQDYADEKRIWNEFLSSLSKVPNPVIIHYGAYEKTFFRTMEERYGGPARDSFAAKALASSLNVVSAMYALIYFPTYANSLKDIAALLGFKWEAPDASGLRTIEWRLDWESGRDDKLKDYLIRYNRDDCSALAVLTEQLLQICGNPRSSADLVRPDDPITAINARSSEIHRSLKLVLNSAHWDYNKARIRLNAQIEAPEPSVTKAQRARPRARKQLSVKGREVRLPRKRKCQRHLERPTLLRPQNTVTEHALIDIAFTSAGCRKTLVRYVGKNARCPYCCGTFPPPAVKRVRNQLYDHGFHSWVVYLRVALRLSYRLIVKATGDLFHERLTNASAEAIVRRVSEKHELTEKRLLTRILASPAIHVDETRLSILGVQQYVWVLTDGKHVVFRLTEGRETDFLVPILTDYKGTLVSDFYGGYDALPCRQQKCLVHLIRDLNDDLWKRPFDSEFENFVAAVRDLLLPIMEEVNRFGLKAYHLRKYDIKVRQFYGRSIEGEPAQHELIAKYQKRFLRFEKSLFTFLHHDDVPWNNNAAERALRHLAVQRKISGAFTTKGAGHYLRLLGVAQSCLFQGKSFLGFLLSELDDVDSFKGRQRRAMAAAFDEETD